MNFTMWRRALQVIPRISKEEWNQLDIISKWMISSRAVVLIMTFISASIAGILSLRDSNFHPIRWLLLVIGLIMAHATNNLLNDFVDYTRGVDQDNYYRAQYGPQPLVHGLLTRRQILLYASVSGLIAVLCGAALVYFQGGLTWLLLMLGAFFVLFYTWPLKYFALGEIAVLIVWGPLMIAGGYYTISGIWDWNILIASLPYALGVTGVIFGKHIDKCEMDRERRIFTLPVIFGEQTSRMLVIGMFILQYLAVIYLVAVSFFSPVLLVVLFSVRVLFQIYPMFRKPRPEEKPENYPDVWPNYFVAGAFIHNRRFGFLYLAGLILDTLGRLILRW